MAFKGKNHDLKLDLTPSAVDRAWAAHLSAQRMSPAHMLPYPALTEVSRSSTRAALWRVS